MLKRVRECERCHVTIELQVKWFKRHLAEWQLVNLNSNNLATTNYSFAYQYTHMWHCNSEVDLLHLQIIPEVLSSFEFWFK